MLELKRGFELEPGTALGTVAIKGTRGKRIKGFGSPSMKRPGVGCLWVSRNTRISIDRVAIMTHDISRSARPR